MALKSDGTLQSLVYNNGNIYEENDIIQSLVYHNGDIYEENDIIKAARNVKSFVVSESALIVLTDDDTVVTIDEDYVNSINCKNLVDIASESIVLSNEAKVYDLDSGNVLLNDIVAISNGFVSRNGTLYSDDHNFVYKEVENVKVRVYDEWLERMK